LFTKKGKEYLETRGFKAEIAVEDRHINELKSITGPLPPTQQQTLTILTNMRETAKGAISAIDVYVDSH
jgi:hypothetical protein